MACAYLFRSATIISGDASPPFQSDVLISSGKIVALKPHIDAHPELHHATSEIDAYGLVLCPGFIDMHAHSDLHLLTHPDHEAKVSQGVTTEVVGQDGEFAELHPPGYQSDSTFPSLRHIILPGDHFQADGFHQGSDRRLERKSLGRGMLDTARRRGHVRMENGGRVHGLPRSESHRRQCWSIGTTGEHLPKERTFEALLIHRIFAGQSSITRVRSIRHTCYFLTT